MIEMKNLICTIFLALSSFFCSSQNTIYSGENFLIEGQFFSKKESYPLPGGTILIKNKEFTKVNEDGKFELVFNDISQIYFPLEISFQFTGYKNQYMYFEDLEELLKIKYIGIPVYFDELDNDLGLIFTVKKSIWCRIKHFFMKPFRKKRIIIEVN